ncbi:MAG TPA: PQQ-binding-like beta-propeller repeat protein [Gaiellaceae bacterium]|nr:PQQ-binding-like beta-propeller repeat protein [Gaiellaceae bacterium]
MRRAFVLLLLLVAFPAAGARGATTASWPLFGFDTARSNQGPDATGITTLNIARLAHRRIHLDGTVDSSPVYWNGTIFVTTTYGRTEAIDSRTGRVKWRFVPPAYSRIAGSAQITNASPAIDPSGASVYAAAPDGRVRKLRASNGHVMWTVAVTRDPTHEKITSSLNVSRGLVIATTGGYIGDAPPYQGHVVTIGVSSGRISHVWNSLCADRHTVIVPRTCPASDSAIWSRNGAAVDPATGNLVVASGNGPYDGSANFGDAVIVLTPNASRMVGHWAPSNQAQLESSDLDLGSTSPGLLPNGYAVQGGKDGVLRLLQLHGHPHLVQSLKVPGPTDMFSAPAIWKGKWVFVATSAGTAAYTFSGGRLHEAWSNGTDGTSPIVTGSMVFVAGNGAIHVYAPSSGRLVATLPTGSVHWQSPIVMDRTIVMPEGNANDHATSGVLDVFRAR